jgi:hypothetical protein
MSYATSPPFLDNLHGCLTKKGPKKKIRLGIVKMHKALIALALTVSVLLVWILHRRKLHSAGLGDILWSRGPFAPGGYAGKHTESTQTEDVLAAHMRGCTGILWIRSGSAGTVSDLDLVAANLSELRNQVVLVTSGDRAVPSSYGDRTVRAILESPKITRWLTQNYDGSIAHPKLRAIPIGLDVHAKGHTKAAVARAVSNRMALPKRLTGPLCCFMSPSHPERAAMMETIRDNPAVVFDTHRRTFDETMRLYTRYRFVLSPRGNGLDCHRTWEALIAGCIVITKTSPLDAMYAQNGLPVVVIGEWDDLNVDTRRKLAQWEARYGPLTAHGVLMPKMRFGYWVAPALVVGGTARDCAPFLPGVFARLDALADGRRVYYVFYESNSADDTLEQLRAFVAARDGNVFTERTRGSRTERIARGRNAIVSHVESVAAAYDFFVNLDLDDRCQFEVRSARECIARAQEWDVATSNRTGEYYDRWALRTEAMGDMYEGAAHCIVDSTVIGGAACAPLPPISAWFPGDAELEGKPTFPRNGAYRRVMSAFGGLAIYKVGLLRGARYAGTGANGAPECEHVPFHAAIRKRFPNTRIVIAPYLISGP